MKRPWLLLLAVTWIFTPAFAQILAERRDQALIGTMMHNVDSALTNGAEVYVLTFQKYAVTTPAPTGVEIGKADFSVKETVYGRKLEMLSLPVIFDRQRMSSRGLIRLWPDPAQLKAGDQLLCVVVPWYDDPKIEGVPGTLLHVYPMDKPDAPIVLTYRRLAKIAAQKDEQLLKSLDDSMADSDPLIREYVRTAAKYSLTPQQAVPLLIKQLRSAAALNASSSEIREMCEALRVAFHARGSTAAERALGAAALVDAINTTNKDVCGQALLELWSIIADKLDGFDRPANVLAAPRIAQLKDTCEKIAAAADSNTNSISAAKAVLEWLTK